jgi:hypothetical protein
MTEPRKSPVDVVIVAVPETAGSALYGMAIEFNDSPFCQRSHINALSDSVKYLLLRYFINNTSFSIVRV